MTAPPFRFSRLGPRGTGKQLGAPNRRRIANAMVGRGSAAGPIPAGFTYLGQFIDHDLTFDKTTVMLGDHISPAQLIQASSPSLDLDSLYGAGPQDPASADLLRGRRAAPEDGEDGRSAEPAGVRPATRRGQHERAAPEGHHP